MIDIKRVVELFKRLGLQEYHAKTMAHLLRLGRTTAPEISKASKVPKARIYGVLEDLGDMGFIEVFSGRPKQYRAKSPADIVRNKIEFERSRLASALESVEKLEGEFVDLLSPLFEEAERQVEETQLLSIVKVGEPSNRQTRLLYDKASTEIDICSKVLEYFNEVKERLSAAADRGVGIKILLLTADQLSEGSRKVQADVIERIGEALPEAEVRFASSKLPLRGSIVDPSYDYEGGSAIFLVEEEEVPLFMRDAAVTRNPSLVAGMKKYFDLIWKYESSPTPD